MLTAEEAAKVRAILESDPRARNFPNQARAAEGSPSQSMAALVREKYHQVVSKNREDTIQKALEQFSDERLTRYPSREDVDIRSYVPMYELWCSEAFGYTFGRPIGYVPREDEVSLVTKFTREFDRSLIPLQGAREEKWFKAISGEPPSQDEMDILQRLTRERGLKK